MFGVRSSGGLVACEVEIGVERVEDHHGEFGAEAIEFFLGPEAVEAGGSGDVFGEGVAEVALADEDIAQKASGVNVVDAAAGLAVSVGEAEENFALIGELGTKVPALGGVDLGMMPLGTMH